MFETVRDCGTDSYGRVSSTGDVTPSLEEQEEQAKAYARYIGKVVKSPRKRKSESARVDENDGKRPEGFVYDRASSTGDVMTSLEEQEEQAKAYARYIGKVVKSPRKRKSESARVDENDGKRPEGFVAVYIRISGICHLLIG